MKKQDLNKMVKKAEKANPKTAIDSLVKEILVTELSDIQRITTEGFEGEQYSDGTAFIYQLEDCFVVLIDTNENDEIHYCKEIDEAQKIATDKLYYNTFNVA